MIGPTFSIIVPTYNRPEMLSDTIDCVLAQDYSDWELLVVDDGSLPRTVLTSNDERIRLLRQPNAGPGAARLRGLTAARGTIVCFLDDDDRYLPGHLSSLAAAVVDTDSIYATGMYVQEATGERSISPLFPSGAGALQAYWSHPVSLLPFAIPRSIALQYPMPTMPVTIEDFEWLCRLLSVCPVKQLPDYTTTYYRHATNRTNRLIDYETLYARERSVERAYAWPEVRSIISPTAYRKNMTHQRLHWVRQCARAGQLRSAAHGFWRALGQAPFASGREIGYTILRGLYDVGRRLLRLG